MELSIELGTGRAGLDFFHGSDPENTGLFRKGKDQAFVDELKSLKLEKK